MATATSRLQTPSKPDARLLATTPAAGEVLTWTRTIRSGEVLSSILLDTAIILLNGIWLLLLFGERLNTGIQRSGADPSFLLSDFAQHLGGLFAYAGLILLTCATTNLYDQTPALDNFSPYVIATPVALSTALFALCLPSLHVKAEYWLFLGAMALTDTAGLSGWRFLRYKVAASRAIDGHRTRRALIIGAGNTGRKLDAYLKSHGALGYTVTGFLDDNSDGNPTVLGTVSEFPSIARSEFVDDVFIAGNLDPALIQQLSEEAKHCGIDVKLVPDICEYAVSWECVGDLPVMIIRSEPIPILGLFLKRMLDVTGALVGLFILLPVLFIIGVLIRLDSHGPVLYRSRRVGKKGAVFECVKFRTMSINADRIKDQLRALNQRVGPTFKISNDPRITRVGKWLRQYSLDELPQLWNVLRGEMSLVGPRPHPLDDYDQYALDHRLRLKVTPGLTGLWQIKARMDPSFEQNMALDLEYIHNWSFGMDIRILLGTIPAVLRGEGR
ncbi:MAG TPA: sugar transferase [Bryobacteraceae bacterium]|jgi:exopolysaccharide biosynthesis polyprenyl glycosylphosphotransferase|nr:sugar transferase [Bryobacteraceae bacterium]